MKRGGGALLTDFQHKISNWCSGRHNQARTMTFGTEHRHDLTFMHFLVFLGLEVFDLHFDLITTT